RGEQGLRLRTRVVGHCPHGRREPPRIPGCFKFCFPEGETVTKSMKANGPDRPPVPRLKYPRHMTIRGRASIVYHVFALALSDVTRPSPDEMVAALEALGQDPYNPRCVYCGSPATGWDHLNPIVHDHNWTGWPSTIGNLVPACGPCNQSKAGKRWRDFVSAELPTYGLLDRYEKRFARDPTAALQQLEEVGGEEYQQFLQIRG